jgi:hypothetical protein
MSFRVLQCLFGSFRVFSGLFGCLFWSSRVFLGLVGSFRFFSGLLGKNHCPVLDDFFKTLFSKIRMSCNFEKMHLWGWLSVHVKPIRYKTPIKEIRIRIYLPFWPDKVMGDLHWGSSLVFQHFLLACHSITGTQTCFLTPMFASECLLSVRREQHLNGLLTMAGITSHSWHSAVLNYYDFVKQ